MPGPYLIGIDGGTQSTKVVVVDAEGRVVAEGREPLRPMSRPSAWRRLPPGRRPLGLAHRCEPPGDGASSTAIPSEIAAVGLCTIRCCKAFLDADGSLVEPVISWMDDRAYQPYLPDDPNLAYATTSSGYLGHRLTGEHRDSAANNILLQWPIDVDRWDWSDDAVLFERFRVRREQLFELQLPGEVIGSMTPAAAAATGIPAGLPVVSTANDKAVEALGAGPIGETTALVSLGTYIAAMVPGHENHEGAASFWTNFGASPHRYLYESHGVRRGMWTLSWFLDLLGPELVERAASLGVSREELIEAEAGGVPAGSDGLMTVLDWLAPTDAPFRKGVMLGFDARHTRGHVYRSILEAIALTMKHNVDAMGRRSRHHDRRDRGPRWRSVEPALHADLRRRVRDPGDPQHRPCGCEASARRSAPRPQPASTPTSRPPPTG